MRALPLRCQNLLLACPDLHCCRILEAQPCGQHGAIGSPKRHHWGLGAAILVAQVLKLWGEVCDLGSLACCCMCATTGAARCRAGTPKHPRDVLLHRGAPNEVVLGASQVAC